MLLSSLIVFAAQAAQRAPRHVQISGTNTDRFIQNEYISFWEDSTAARSFSQLYLQKEQLFQTSNKKSLTNPSKNSAYWLWFVLENNSDNPHFRIELFDFDIDEVSLLIPASDESIREEKIGFSSSFYDRKVQHKNLGFDLTLAKGACTEVFLRVKSNRINMLIPVLRPYESFVGYALGEYFLLGIFNGLMLLILFYNLIYFLILRKIHFLYYVLYGSSMLLFLNTRNGIGFQFLWPQHPFFNNHISTLSLSASTIFILLFCIAYLDLRKRSAGAYRLAVAAIGSKIVLTILHLLVGYDLLFNLMDYVLFQLCFVLGFIVFRSNYSRIRWYILSFIMLNFSLLIFLGEHYDWIPSGIFTVYSLNIGVLVQFIFLSIGIAESIRDIDRDKHQALAELLHTRERNEALRLTELKQQMNPHFLFNALNSIQSRIISNKKEEASRFLILFSKLIRKNLEISEQEFIFLEDELNNLQLYLELENMRLGDSFTYTIHCTPSLAAATIRIPTFVVQPLVENAIWHGLMPLSTDKKLWIKVIVEETNLCIRIEDNGIGRRRSYLLKQDRPHVSKGLSLVHERLELISKKSGKENKLCLTDLEDLGRSGTEAILIFER
jgi:sensor histidine kinase YesM